MFSHPRVVLKMKWNNIWEEPSTLISAQQNGNVLPFLVLSP